MANVAEEPTSVYILYGADREVLYVGISARPGQRLADHETRQDWWSGVARVDIEPYASRDKAAFRESLLIKAFQPPHNVAHKEHLTGSGHVQHVRGTCGVKGKRHARR